MYPIIRNLIGLVMGAVGFGIALQLDATLYGSAVTGLLIYSVLYNIFLHWSFWTNYNRSKHLLRKLQEVVPPRISNL